MIGKIRDGDIEKDKHLVIFDFDFKEPGKANRIEFLNLTQPLWAGYLYEK